MKRILALILCITLFTSGCTSNQSTSSSMNNRIEQNTSSINIDDNIEKNTSSMEVEIAETDLFKTIYSPYAKRENSFVFNNVKEFVQNKEYTVEITEPTSDDFGSIKVSDTNGDYVYFAFNLTNDFETIMSVSYFCEEKQAEVSLNNYSTDGSRKYDRLSIHVIGENAYDVKDLDEQRSFLFQN